MNLLYLMPNSQVSHDVSEDDLVEAMRNPPVIAEADKPELLGMIAILMERATSNRVRNAAAILLTDLVGKDATESIVGVLRRPEMAQAAGSLLFALNDVEAKLPLDLAINIVEYGSLEAQGEALTFLQDARIESFTAGERDEARGRLDSLLKNSGNPNITHAAGFALEYLDDLAAEPMQGSRA